MSDPTAGLPPASGDTPNPSNPIPAGQPVVTPQANPPASNQPTTPPASTPPNPTESQLAEAQRQLAEAQQYARRLQSERDRAVHQVHALAGVQQPQQQQDPFAASMEKLKAQGFDPKEVRPIFEELHQSFVAPLQQQFQASTVAMQNNAQIENAIRSAYTQAPQVLSDGRVLADVQVQMQEMARQSAAEGRPWDPNVAANLALNFAFQSYGAHNFVQKPGQQPTQQPQAPLSIPTMFGTSGTPGAPSQTPVQTKPAWTADMNRVDADLKSFLPPGAKPPTQK